MNKHVTTINTKEYVNEPSATGGFLTLSSNKQ